MEEWRRLTTLYSEMGDIEIRDLVDQINDLTPNAQQILRDELKKRSIPEKSVAQSVHSPDPDNSLIHWDGREDSDLDPDNNASEIAATEYTWKTGLCRCNSIDEAAQWCEMLSRAGIETWVQRPGSRFIIPWIDELGVGDIQINVAADQLEQARAVIVQPIPQDVIDQVKQEKEIPAYEVPTCPKCKAEDPILESVEPSNNWLCESCGYTWSDPIPDSTEIQPAG
ncbi:MAG TPA: hypothetical protein VK574_21010 [Terracidiphilus sp.]|nr:hypothetical protein [Terracidiphilus sp.]